MVDRASNLVNMHVRLLWRRFYTWGNTQVQLGSLTSCSLSRTCAAALAAVAGLVLWGVALMLVPALARTGSCASALSGTLSMRYLVARVAAPAVLYCLGLACR